MKLESITVQNFKGIRRKAVIPLAPVTMLFGANSSGKSSILHAFFYLYELLVNKNADPEYSTITGEHIYLGGFSELVNGKDLSKTITLGVTFSLDPKMDFYNTFMTDSDSNVCEGYISNVSAPVMHYAIEMDIGYSEFENRAFVKQSRVSINHQLFCSLSAAAGKKSVTIEVLQDLALFVIGDRDDDEFPPFLDVGPFELNLPYKALLNVDERVGLEDAPLEWDLICSEKPLAGRIITECAFADTVLAPLRHFSKRLQQLIHIGPLRVIPNRSFVAKRSPDKPRWFNGEAGWDAFAFGSSVLQQEVNDWYKNHFNCPYQFLKSPSGYGVALADSNSAMPLLPSQVGAGVSQIFPFVVAAVKPDVGMISIEQPELHLHPAWQVELADLMLTQTNQYSADKLFLVETHSEHMVLRLLKRIRESQDASLPLDSKLAQIIFCEVFDGETRIRPIGITSDGDFDTAWPNGFFEERGKELF
ncbi:AAA family ATPase [Rheinheimera tilapiae]|uniref:AAA family ATPase n=1 Tax=Rheinheimera tilapiae TaxID=875043 RepID=A0ABV6BCG4_9GAMM